VQCGRYGGSNTAWDYNAGLVPAVLGDSSTAYAATIARATALTVDDSRFPAYATSGGYGDGAPQVLYSTVTPRGLIVPNTPRVFFKLHPLSHDRFGVCVHLKSNTCFSLASLKAGLLIVLIVR